MGFFMGGKTMIEENYDLYIQQHQTVIVLFGSLSCHPCQALKKRLILWQKEHLSMQVVMW